MRIIIALFISFSLFSCNSASHSDIDKSLPQVTDGNTAFPTVQADSTKIDVNGIPQAPAEVYTAANLNPPHGQPGHDCSVAVGAPLNRPSATQNAPAPLPAPAKLQTAKLNPPHGEPGHRCEIPVGQPLP